jgi:hypothetical protein
MAPIIKSVFGGGGGVANLAYTASPTQGTVTSDTGTDAIIPAADGTNAGLFLPAEKTKLAGIAEGAEVNVNADWNAVSGDAQILNKPTLGTAAATNSTDYATAAQGAKADTAVQPAAIGSTVLAFDSNLQSFVNAFTLPTTDGTAGQSLVTNGAGVISFATPAILADPVYIGGVAYFNRSTKPTERSAGVALVAGDRWYKTDDQTEWSWNGTYWLGKEQHTFYQDQPSPTTKNYTNNIYNLFAAAATTINFNSNYVLVQSLELYITAYSHPFFTGTLDASNKFDVGISGVAAGKVTIDNLSFFNDRNSVPRQLISSPVTIPGQATSETPSVLMVIDNVIGSPSITWAAVFVQTVVATYREIYP